MTTPQKYFHLTNNTNPTWWKDPGMRMGIIHVLILYSQVFSLGYDGALLTGLQALPRWNADFDSPAGTTLGLIAAAYYLPKIPLNPLVAWMNDRFGRKIGLYVGAAFMIAGALIGGFAVDTGMFAGARVFLGIGTATSQIAVNTLIPEIAHPRTRHYASSYYNTVYYIGSICAAWITYGMVYYPGDTYWSWRIPTLLQCLGAVVLLLGSWFVPQSPRWLLAQGREADAHKILAKYHANGLLEDELVLFEMREIKSAVEVERRMKQGQIWSLVRDRGNRRRLGIVVMIGTALAWAGNGVVQFYLVPVLKTVGITAAPQTAGINGGLSIWAWFCALGGAGVVERFGRRKLFLLSIGGMWCCFVIITGLAGGYNSTKNTDTGIAMVPFIYLFQGFYSLALTPLPYLYVPEICPLTNRSRYLAILAMTGNTAQALNQFANPVALAAIGWQYYGVYVAVLAIYFALFYFFIKETRGLTIEEAAMVYDVREVKEAVALEERKLENEAYALQDTAKGDAPVHEEHV